MTNMKPGQRIVCEVCGVNVQPDEARRSATGWRHEPSDCMQRYVHPNDVRSYRLPVFPGLTAQGLDDTTLIPMPDEPLNVEWCDVQVDPLEPTRHVCEKGHNILLVPERP